MTSTGRNGYSVSPRQQPYAQEAYYIDPSHRLKQPFTDPRAQRATVVSTPVSNQPPLQQPVVVVMQQDPRAVVAGEQLPPDYCCLSWFSCLCCWPIAIWAICMSQSVLTRFQNSDFQGARRASESARKLALTAIGFGIMIIIVSSVSSAESTEDLDDSGASGSG
ncbi:unnamed protein product [Ascophyllum nodosum]